MTPSKAKPSTALPTGRLDWRMLLRWLSEDGLIGRDDAVRVTQRFGAGDSSLHPLVRLAGAELTRLVKQRIQLVNLTGHPLGFDAGQFGFSDGIHRCRDYWSVNDYVTRKM